MLIEILFKQWSFRGDNSALLCYKRDESFKMHLIKFLGETKKE